MQGIRADRLAQDGYETSQRYRFPFSPKRPVPARARASLMGTQQTGARGQSLISAFPWIWLALIVASQTAAAGQLADSLFALLFGTGDSDGGELHFTLQKGYHVGLFAVFGYLLALPHARRSRPACLWLAATAGVAAESLQLLASGRSPQIGDAVLNVCAGVGAVLLAFAYLRTRPTPAVFGAGSSTGSR
jgi:hypothetical protein